MLLFALGMRDVPVDTHVSRVGTRLGLFRPSAPFEEMHDEMLAITPPGEELEFHLNLLRHGRRTCHARRAGLRRVRPPEDVPERVQGGVRAPGGRGQPGGGRAIGPGGASSVESSGLACPNP